MHNRTILLVEDEAIIALAEKRMIEQHGFAVITATSGTRAIEALNANPGIDLVLMDIDLGPGMPGTEAAEKILAEHEVPLVFLSSHTEPEVVEKTEGITSYGYIVKSSGEMVLIASIKMAFRLSEANLELKKISQAVRQSPVTVMITDTDARIEYVNPKFSELTGYTEAEALGENPRILQSGMTSEEVYRDLWKTVTAGKEWQGTFWNRKKNGELYCENAFIAPVMDEAGTILNYIAVKEDITQRVKAEEDLTRCSSRFSALAEASPILIWESDDNKMCTYFNARWLSYTGRTMKEELGFGWTEGVHPDDLDACLHTFTVAFDQREPFAMEYRLRKADGSYGWIYDQGSPKFEQEDRFAGYIGACTDVTELKDAQSTLRENEQLLRILFDSARDNILIHELQDDGLPGPFIAVNESSCRSLGYSREELMAMSPLETTEMPDHDFVRTMLATVVDRGSALFEATGRRKDGERVPFELHVHNIHRDGRNLIMAISRDITERKEKDAELHRLLNEKELILKEVHHRIKNNMLMLSGFLSLQSSRMKSPDAEMALEELKKRIESTVVLYETLQNSESFQRVNTGDYFGTLIDRIRELLPGEQEIRIDTDIEDFSLPVRMVTPLGIIVNELITNAIKHAFPQRDRGLITVSAKTGQSERAVFTVKDDGSGIPEYIDPSASPGLGLSLVDSLSAQIGGVVTIARKGGTTVTVSVDLQNGP